MAPRRLLPYGLVLPSLLVLAALYLAPIGYFLVVSFWRVENYRITADPNLDNYRRVFGEYWPIGLLTFRLALITAAITPVLGFPYPWILRFKARPLGPLLLVFPLITKFRRHLIES